MGVHVKSVHEGNVEGQINAHILALGFLQLVSGPQRQICILFGRTLPLAVFCGVLLNPKPSNPKPSKP